MTAWVLSPAAIAAGARVLRCSRDDAEDRLRKLQPTATRRETDRRGRELWRSPSRAYGLRWVVDTHARPPVVLWVGQGAPPAAHWDPAPSAELRRGEVTITVTLDVTAVQQLEELRAALRNRDASSRPAPGDVIGRAIRLLYETERRG